MALIALADVKTHLDISNDTTNDTFITTLASMSDKVCKSYTGRALEAADYTQDYDGLGGDVLQLRQYPINSITSIKDDTNREFGSSTTLSSSDYTYRSASGIVYLVNGLTFVAGRLNIRVVYNGGYSTIPEDLKQAAVILAASYYKLSDVGDHRLGISSKSFLDGSISSFSLGMPKEVTDILDFYKDWGKVNG